ncbi:unnamed protein product [Paramecium pentaurelia]|uniref:Acid phosphatase n=1 Tax=Paramecium pentaurelia TaxID=43138 RepID=A0A8S1XGQ6_9CILI|nr:unnamed protein product [Paramecium pentaurelia]
MQQLLFLLISVVLAQDDLITVQVVWRHGARNYYHCNWNCIEDQPRGDEAVLTPTGMRQQYVLGKWLRQRYIIDNQFLSSKFNENEIYIESSDENRTLTSAYCNLLGMYPEGPSIPQFEKENESLLLPPNQDAQIPKDLGDNALPHKIQLIPIHTKQKSLHSAIVIQCPKIETFNRETQLYKEVNVASAQLYDEFNKELNLQGEQKVNDIIELSHWRDTFICNRYNGDPLPPNLKPHTLQQLDNIANLAQSLERFQTQDQVKIQSTPYFQRLIEHFDSALNGSQYFKYFASSAHDTTLGCFLSALNLTSAQCQADIYLKKNITYNKCMTKYVEFAANLIFELYNNINIGPFVKVLYNGEYVPICSDFAKTCQYTRFRSIITAQLVDYQKLCIESNDETYRVSQTPKWAYTFFSLTILLLLLVLSWILYLRSQQGYRDQN